MSGRGIVDLRVGRLVFDLREELEMRVLVSCVLVILLEWVVVQVMVQTLGVVVL